MVSKDHNFAASHMFMEVSKHRLNETKLEM